MSDTDTRRQIEEALVVFDCGAEDRVELFGEEVARVAPIWRSEGGAGLGVYMAEGAKIATGNWAELMLVARVNSVCGAKAAIASIIAERIRQ